MIKSIKINFNRDNYCIIDDKKFIHYHIMINDSIFDIKHNSIGYIDKDVVELVNDKWLFDLFKTNLEIFKNVLERLKEKI